MSRLGDAALAYAERGRPVFPLVPGGKVPVIPRREGGRGFLDATTDPDQLRQWWERWPAANIGLPTGKVSRVVVLDIDARAGGYGSLALLEAGREGLVTLEAGTPNGAHLYFAWPGVELRNSASKLGAGLDIRAEGGYVVLPPSVRPDGVYVWCDRAMQPAEVPLWLLELLLPKPAPRPVPLPIEDLGRLNRYGYSALVGELRRLRDAPVGKRNDQLFRSAFALGQLVAAGVLPGALVCDELLEMALRIGLTDREAKATIMSGVDRGLQHPRGLR